MGKSYTARQRSGGQFSGNTQQNTTQPKASWEDLSAADKVKLIKTTGQDADPAAVARVRHMQGQSGKQPADPQPPRYTG